LRGCLYSLQKDTKLNNYEVIIVDSGSTDGTIQFLSTQPNIRVIEDELRGASKAAIKGFKEACGEYVCWLNDDLIVVDNAITNMLTFLEREECNGVGMGAFCLSEGKNNSFNTKGKNDTFNIKSFFGLPHADLGMIKTSLMRELNYFDESFIKYSADIDFSLRIWERGLLVAGCRQAKLKHLFVEDEHRESSSWIGECDYRLFIKKWDRPRVDNLIFSVSEEVINRYFGDCEKLQYLLMKGLILQEKGEHKASNDILRNADALFESILRSKSTKTGNVAFLVYLLTVAGTWYLDLEEYNIAEGLLKFISSLKVKNNEDEEIICQVSIASIRLGRLYSQQGKFIEAEAELKKALSLEPPDRNVKANVLYAMGSNYERQGKWNEAIERFNYVVNNGPLSIKFSGGSHFHLGYIYKELGKEKEAKQHFEECLRIIPNHKKAKEYLEVNLPR